MIRVGRREYLPGGKYKDPVYEGFTPVLCLTQSSQYGDISPYCVSNDEGIFENVWQFSKLYERVPVSRQTYSRWDNTVIWEHKAEVHTDETGNPNEAYWAWREKGFKCGYPIRYPVGRYHRHKCIGSLYKEKSDEKEESYVLLDYISARKLIYLNGYLDCITELERFKSLKSRLDKGENLLIIEVDGPHQESLSYYKDKYNVSDDFISGNTMIANRENLEIMLNDSKHPFGHGYCIAWGLLGLPKIET